MINEKTGGPAFPTETNFHRLHGMTLRDYFAAEAMNGLLAGLLADGMDIQWDSIAKDSYRQADAMLKAREE